MTQLIRIMRLLRLGVAMSAVPISVVPGAGDVELARDALRLVDEALTENTTDGPVTLTVAGAAENVVVPKTVVGLHALFQYLDAARA